MRPIIGLSLHQVLTRWRALAILGLAVLPILVSAIHAAFASPAEQSSGNVDNVILNGLLAAAVLPVVALAVASAVFGNELEDKTLGYLALKPLARWRIVAPKLVAAAAVTGVVVALSGGISLGIAVRGDSAAVPAAVVSLLLGAVAYSTLFLWLGLMTTRALGFGLLYVFLWEGLFTSFVHGARYLSIRQYTLSLAHSMDHHLLASSAGSLVELPAAIGGLVVVTVVFFVLTVRRLRTMDVP